MIFRVQVDYLIFLFQLCPYHGLKFGSCNFDPHAQHDPRSSTVYTILNGCTPITGKVADKVREWRFGVGRDGIFEGG